MKKLAIDIALMPDESMCAQVMELSRILADQGSKLVLGEKAVPHITLVQGVINEEQLDQTSSILEGIAKSYQKLDLAVDEIYVGPMSGSVWLKVRNSGQVRNLVRR